LSTEHINLPLQVPDVAQQLARMCRDIRFRRPDHLRQLEEAMDVRAAAQAIADREAKVSMGSVTQ
jgi:hypothetical protein